MRHSTVLVGLLVVTLGTANNGTVYGVDITGRRPHKTGKDIFNLFLPYINSQLPTIFVIA